MDGIDLNITWNSKANTAPKAGSVVWLTGLSGAGKTTLARRVEDALCQRAVPVCRLDGDELRGGLCSDLGFSAQDRSENIRRVAEVAHLIARLGHVVIVSLISPFRADRQRAREIVEANGLRFLEVFVNTSLEVCQARDPKHLYQRVHRGEIKQFTGIDSPYEAPERPELVIVTDSQTEEESARCLLLAVEGLLQVVDANASKV